MFVLGFGRFCIVIGQEVQKQRKTLDSETTVKFIFQGCGIIK
jgi:hypothetical protein